MTYPFSLQYMRDELRSPQLWQGVFAEFMATFLLISYNANNSMNNTDGSPGLRFALGAGLAVAALIETFVHISGGHMNPAITLGFFITQRISIVRGILYIISQSVASVAAVATWVYTLDSEFASNFAGPSIHPKVTLVQAVFIECFVTFTLLIVTLGSIDDRYKKLHMPVLLIGFSVTIGLMSFGRYTGASMNPVIALGPTLVTGEWSTHWVYWVGPMTGSALASIVYQYIFTLQTTIRKDRTEEMISTKEVFEITDINAAMSPSTPTERMSNGRLDRNDGHVQTRGMMTGGISNGGLDLEDEQSRGTAEEYTHM